MKQFQKFLLPILAVAIVAILYMSYFAPKDDLGLFSGFDTNSNANHDIQVRLVKDKGFTVDKNAGATVFYVTDKVGKEVRVQAPLTMPPGMDMATVVVLRGHLHTDYFHAASVSIL